MARFNIEDELRVDPRFDALCMSIGRQMAYGALCCLWELGQAYWKRQGSLIPKHIAEQTPNITELVQTGFLIEREGGYYCSGAEERWSFLRSKSLAGKKSAEVRRKKFGTAQPAAPEQTPNRLEHAEPSSSSSSSKELILIGTSDEAPFDFELVYQEYPKRKNTKKGLGLSRLKNQIKTKDDYLGAIQAAKHYREYCTEKQTEMAFIKQFSTWASEWREWVDPGPEDSFTETHMSMCGVVDV